MIDKKTITIVSMFLILLTFTILLAILSWKNSNEIESLQGEIAILTEELDLLNSSITNDDTDEDSDSHRESEGEVPAAETHQDEFDFGKIRKADGVKSTTFEIENHGKGMLEIGEISTSCACTSAEVDKKELGFNDHATLTVYFDPNVHEEPEGRFNRTVYVKTNDPEVPELEFNIYIEIID